jgi:myo-inositol 2-dehydrogenase/D-chiro-inositol 1-dehydrogenase
MAEALRFGIVGAGLMAREHIRNLKLFPETRIVALADPEPASIELSMETLGEASVGVQAFETAETLLTKAKVDAVIVASPNYTHRAVLEPLFDAGVAILCEKPLCTTVEDARWAAARAAESSAVFWTGMEYRFMPPVSRFVSELREGQIGKLTMLTIREHRFPFLVKVGDWNRFNRNTGGTMVEKCCHFFDLMRLIVDAEPVSVFCSGAMDVNHLDERYDGERPDIIDNSFTVVDFANGARAMLDLCMFAEGEEQQEAVAAVGDRAKLEVTIPSGDLVLSPRVPLRAPKQTRRTNVPVDEAALKAGSHHGATFYQLAGFLEAVHGRGPVQVTAEDGLKAVIMGMAAEVSARERRVVRIDEFG